MNGEMTGSSKMLFVSLTVAVIAGCSRDDYTNQVLLEREFLAESKKQIVLGMSENDIIGIAGQPDSIIKSPDGSSLLVYGTDVVKRDKGKMVVTGFTVEVVAGEVTRVAEIETFPD